MKQRSPKFQLDEVPNHWFEGNALLTYIGNAFHATVPSAERFLIRALARLKDSLPSEEQATLRVFMGQEGQHAAAHDAFSKVLVSQGYDPAPLTRAHDRAYSWFERISSPILRVSASAAFEHYTATLGDDTMVRKATFQSSHPGAKALMVWHAAEEVEHRSVVFDALTRLNPSYLLRASGFAVASAILVISTVVSVAYFAWRDPARPRWQLAKEIGRMIARFPYARTAFLTLEYLRPGFHPSQRGETARAVEVLLTY